MPATWVTLTELAQIQYPRTASSDPTYTAVSTTPPDNIFDSPGSRLSILDPTYGRMDFIWVQNKGAATAAGDLVYYSTDSTYGFTVSHTIGTAAAQGPRTQFAGVAVSVIAQNYYGWIQVFGYHPNVLCANDTYINGMVLQASATDSTAEKVGAAGTAPTYPIVGRALGAQVGSSPYYVPTQINVGKF